MNVTVHIFSIETSENTSAVKQKQTRHFIFTLVTSSSAIAERPCDTQVTSIRKIAKWNF